MTPIAGASEGTYRFTTASGDDGTQFRAVFRNSLGSIVSNAARLTIGRPFGRRQDVIVRIVLDQHVRKTEARVLYDDITPPPTPAEVEMRRLERQYRAAAQAAGTPDRRRRREIRRAQGKV